MPNWCNNIVRFRAEPAITKQIVEVFNGLAQLQAATGHGQLPKGYQGDEGHLFDITWEGSELRYVTQWVPNTPVLLAVALCYGAEFIHQYKETENEIYGITAYANGEIRDTELTAADFACYAYNEARQICRFEENEFDSDLDVLEFLLDRKRQAGRNMP
jgi:hypothetical protein